MKTFRISFLLSLAALLLIAGCSSGSRLSQIEITPEELEEVVSSVDPETVDDPVQLLALAEYSYSRRKFDDSLGHVQKILAQFSETAHTDHAYYLRGMIYQSVLYFRMDLQKAAASFRMVMSSPPETDFDEMAEDQLKQLEKRRK